MDRAPEEFEKLLDTLEDRQGEIEYEVNAVHFYLSMGDYEKVAEHKKIAEQLMDSFERDFESSFGVTTDEIIRLSKES